VTETTVRHRPITQKLLDEFEEWTRTADMFRSSPQGIAFAEEMRAVINLAREAIRMTDRTETTA
jgi:hypothetical protein